MFSLISLTGKKKTDPDYVSSDKSTLSSASINPVVFEVSVTPNDKEDIREIAITIPNDISEEVNSEGDEDTDGDVDWEAFNKV